MTPFRSPERDAALDRLLAAGLGADTWRLLSLRDAAGPDADLLFPGGPLEMIEAHVDLADRRLAAFAAETGLRDGSPSLGRRVRTLVLHRVAFDRAHRDATRRAVALLSLPGHGATATRILARTADTIWRGAGDRSTDFSWYTRRATLGAVHAATVLYALGAGRTDAEIEGFLDRRLVPLAALGRWRRRALPPLSPPAPPTPLQTP